MSVSTFGKDVLEGLSKHPKQLSSKYFYDELGDELFREIMALDEYYLTRSEKSIFHEKKEKITRVLTNKQPMRLIELGAGDGAKTKVLLKYFVEKGIDFSYAPIDISSNVLEILVGDIHREIPQLKIEPVAGDYFKVLSDFKLKNGQRNVVFFLGANIGNFRDQLIKDFLTGLHNNLKEGDLVMIGFDLKKNPHTILNAYNDSKGVTARFNLNLLHRINKELGGNFNVDQFFHFPSYDSISGECRSHLVSKIDQDVFIEETGKTFHFKAWEPIFMEVSRKFDLESITHFASESGFSVVENIFDKENLFCESIWEVS